MEDKDTSKDQESFNRERDYEREALVSKNDGLVREDIEVLTYEECIRKTQGITNKRSKNLKDGKSELE